jgi:hypothetical protein
VGLGLPGYHLIGRSVTPLTEEITVATKASVRQQELRRARKRRKERKKLQIREAIAGGKTKS